MFLSLRSAATYAGVTYEAIRKWTSWYDIGKKVDGRWHIDKVKLDKILWARRQTSELRIRKAG